MSHLLSATETAAILDVSTTTLATWRRDERGPPYKTRGLREVVYDRDDLIAWCEANNVAYQIPEDQPAAS